VISRAAVADKSMAKKRFDELLKQHPPEIRCAERCRSKQPVREKCA